MSNSETAEQQLDYLLRGLTDASDTLAAFPREVREHYEGYLETLSQLVAEQAGDLSKLTRLCELIDEIQRKLAEMKAWPITPVALPHPPPRPVIYYLHEIHGWFQLRWRNPLPIATTAYFCDGCRRRDMQAAWQLVDVEGERDRTRVDGLGFDLCIDCGTKYIADVNERLSIFLAEEEHGSSNTLYRSDKFKTPNVHMNSAKSIFNTLGQSDECRIELGFSCPNNGAAIVAVALPTFLPQRAGPAKEGFVCCPYGDEQTDCLTSTEHFYQLLSSCTPWDVATLSSEASSGPCVLVDAEEAALCSICFEPSTVVTDGRLRPLTTDCGHVFHEGCLRRLLRQATGTDADVTITPMATVPCPMCRQPLSADAFDRPVVVSVSGTEGCSSPPLIPTVRLTIHKSIDGAPIQAGRAYVVLVLSVVDVEHPMDSWAFATKTAVLPSH